MTRRPFLLSLLSAPLAWFGWRKAAPIPPDTLRKVENVRMSYSFYDSKTGRSTPLEARAENVRFHPDGRVTQDPDWQGFSRKVR